VEVVLQIVDLSRLVGLSLHQRGGLLQLVVDITRLVDLLQLSDQQTLVYIDQLADLQLSEHQALVGSEDLQLSDLQTLVGHVDQLLGLHALIHIDQLVDYLLVDLPALVDVDLFELIAQGLWDVGIVGLLFAHDLLARLRQELFEGRMPHRSLGWEHYRL